MNTLFCWDYRGLMRFLEALPAVPWFQPDGSPHADWRLFLRAALSAARCVAAMAAQPHAYGRTWSSRWAANMSTFLDASRHGARGATWAGTWRRATQTASIHTDALAFDTLAFDTLKDAAWAAAFYALTTFTCNDIALPQGHRAYAHRLWTIWQKGYIPLCAIDGTFYVYGLSSAPS